MLDYIEGLFLGKLWSDTDFENRKHVNLFILYGLFVDCIIAFTYFTGNSIPGLGRTGVIQIAILVLLFLLNPFINLRYYRMPLWGKLIVLFEKLCKNVLLVGVSTSLILPRLTVESSELQEFLITYLNSTLEHYTKMFYSSAGSFATCLLYTSDAADDLLCVDLGGRRIIKKKNKIMKNLSLQNPTIQRES